MEHRQVAAAAESVAVATHIEALMVVREEQVGIAGFGTCNNRQGYMKAVAVAEEVGLESLALRDAYPSREGSLQNFDLIGKDSRLMSDCMGTWGHLEMKASLLPSQQPQQ